MLSLAVPIHCCPDVGVDPSMGPYRDQVEASVREGFQVTKIQFMTKYLRTRKNGLTPSDSDRSAYSTVGKALLATTVVFVLGFMVFGASGMTNNQALGLLSETTVIFALLAS